MSEPAHPGADEDNSCHTCDYIAGVEHDALEQRGLVYVGAGLWVDAVALVEAAGEERGTAPRPTYSAR
ncbi:MAG: hypothetical protein ACRDH7_15650 [Actinomycetota bacterium]